jgi:hypothetical protein
MNIIRNIESVTLLAIGAFCAAAVTTIVLQSALMLPGYNASAAATTVTALPTVVVVGKRLSSAEKISLVDQHVAG